MPRRSPAPPPVTCRFCRSNKAVKAGLRKSKTVDKQIYLCNKCGRKFAVSALPFYTYDPQAILNAPILYYQGLSLAETRQKIISRYQITPSLATVAKWVKEFGKYSALKNAQSAIKHFKQTKGRLISRKLLKHQQNYLFQIHEYKLGLLAPDFSPIQDYLHKILKDEIVIDHTQFQLRGSSLELGASFPTPRPAPRKTYENSTAEIALKAAGTNHQRHSVIQKYFLSTDKSTIAVEVPVFLTSLETRSIFKRGGGLLGHIDFLQFLNGRLIILDYKPGAAKEKRVITQLLIYAIALSTRTKIHLNKIDCAWFDEKNYYRFRSLDAYYKFRNHILKNPSPG